MELQPLSMCMLCNSPEAHVREVCLYVKAMNSSAQHGLDLQQTLVINTYLYSEHINNNKSYVLSEGCENMQLEGFLVI